MTAYPTANPFFNLTDAQGKPVTGGRVYIGVSGQDPETHPQAVYWDAAQTQPASQPLAINGGYIVNGASPATPYTASTYSVRAYDALGNMIFYLASVTTITPPVVSTAFTSPVSVTGTFALDNLGSVSPANGSYIGVGGNSLSFQTRVSNPAGGADTDNQRASALIAATTSDDGNSEEQTLCLLTTIQTGYRTTWAPTTAYTTGTNVANGTNVYRCITPGTSAGSGGPTGKGSSITDGTVVWTWINDDMIDSKVGLYNEVDVKPGAGKSWGQAHNVQVESGVLAQFVYNTELDLTNNCGTDSTSGNKVKNNLALYCNGLNTSTSALTLSSSNPSVKAVLWGIKADGTNLAKNSVIQIDASAPVGIGFGVFAGGEVSPTFTDTVIKDGSTAPTGISLGGTYSSSGMSVGGSTPASYVSSGTKTTTSFYDLATTPRGLMLGGTYAKTPLAMPTLPPNYANDAAAAAGGLAIGDVYRNGSVLQVRVT